MQVNVQNSLQLVIHSVVPSINLGETMVSADRRSNKDEKLTDAERIRRVVLPVNHWGSINVTKDGNISQGLLDILRESMKKLAGDRLRDFLAENPMATTAPANDYTIAELLKWSEETATSRGSITFTREQAEKWFDASVTGKALQGKWAAAGDSSDRIKVKLQFMRNRFGALAARNHGITKADDAVKLMALIDPADAGDSIGVEIVGRLEHINKSLTAKAAADNISMDDL